MQLPEVSPRSSTPFGVRSMNNGVRSKNCEDEELKRCGAIVTASGVSSNWCRYSSGVQEAYVCLSFRLLISDVHGCLNSMSDLDGCSRISDQQSSLSLLVSLHGHLLHCDSPTYILKQTVH